MDTKQLREIKNLLVALCHSTKDCQSLGEKIVCRTQFFMEPTEWVEHKHAWKGFCSNFQAAQTR